MLKISTKSVRRIKNETKKIKKKGPSDEGDNSTDADTKL
jgi:hypothetical protein